MKWLKPADFNDCAAKQMIIGRDIIQLTAKMKEGQMNSNDWVAEYVMGFERGGCWGTIGGSSSDGTTSASWVYCDWCGQPVYDGKTGPCPNYPFPKFTLVDLMRKLDEKGYHVMVRIDPERERHKFTAVLTGSRVGDTDNPLELLCDHLYSMRAIWQCFEEVHSAKEPEKKRLVSGEQVVEEYEQLEDRLNWGLLCSRGVCSNRRWNHNDLCVAAILDKPTPEEKPAPAFFANIRDAIKILQRVMRQVEGK